MVNLMDIGLGFGAGIVFGLLLFVLCFILMGSEGRFHLKRGFMGRGVDLMSYEPLGGKISMQSIRWDGKHWVSGDKKKQGFFTSLAPLVDDSAEAKEYNEMLKYHSLWAGCKRSVVFACEEMSMVLNPLVAALLTKSNEAPVDPKVSELVERLKALKDAGVERVNVLRTIDPVTLRGFMDGATPKSLIESYESGRMTERYELTKPKKEGAKLPFSLGWGIAIVLLVIVILVAVTQGDQVRALIQGFIGKK